MGAVRLIEYQLRGVVHIIRIILKCTFGVTVKPRFVGPWLKTYAIRPNGRGCAPNIVTTAHSHLDTAYIQHKTFLSPRR
jgi:hypothetical protein